MNNSKKDMRFDKHAAKYDDGYAGKGSRRFYRLLLNQAKIFDGARVLDVGCGTGTILHRMSQTCAIEGFGIDIEENMIAEAQHKCPQMTFGVTRCDNTLFDSESFDVMTACMAYHHFDNKDGFVKEAARLLKPGGMLYICDPRFPWLIRKAINGAARLFRVHGEFNTSDEVAARFAAHGFTFAGTAHDGYAQVVVLERTV